MPIDNREMFLPPEPGLSPLAQVASWQVTSFVSLWQWLKQPQTE